MDARGCARPSVGADIGEQQRIPEELPGVRMGDGSSSQGVKKKKKEHEPIYTNTREWYAHCSYFYKFAGALDFDSVVAPSLAPRAH